jgi:hypothetical protein
MVAEDPAATKGRVTRLSRFWKLALGIGGAGVVLGGLLWWGFEFGPFRLQAPHNGSGVATGGYLAVASQEVDFFQLTINGSNASGTLTQAKLDSTQVSSHQYSCTGTVSGSNVTLSFPQGFGLVTNLSGEVRGSHLLLSIPQTDGTLASEDFAPSNSGAYNSAVADLQTRAAAALQQQQQAKDAAAQAAADAKARQNIDSDSASVTADISRVQKVNFSNPLAGASANLQTQQGHLAKMRQDEQTARQQPDPSIRCSDVSVVASDASTIASDASSVESDSSGLAGDVGSAQSDAATLASDYSALQTAEAAAPTYQPGSLLTQGQVSSAQATIKKAITDAQNQMSADVTKANTVSSQADSESRSFSMQMGCG